MTTLALEPYHSEPITINSEQEFSDKIVDKRRRRRRKENHRRMARQKVQKSTSGSQIPSSKTTKHPKNGQAYKWYHAALLRIVSSGCSTATEKLFSVENTKLFNFAIANLNQDFVYYKSVFAKPKSDSLSRLVIGEDQKN